MKVRLYTKGKRLKIISAEITSRFFITLTWFCLSANLYAACPAPNINNAPAETIQAAYHATMHYTVDALAVAGAESTPAGGDNNLLTEVIPANGYNYTGSILFGTLGSFSFGGNTQYIILTDDGNLWAWGDENEVLNGTLTTGQTFQMLSLGLPAGVAATDVAEFKATYGTLVLRTNSGEVYMTGHDNGLWNGGSTTAWNQITVDGTNPLSNIVKIDIANEVAFAADSSGNLYTWGEDTYLGNGTGPVFNRPFPTLMTSPLPAGVTVIQAEISRDEDINATYWILGSDLKLYTMGENQNGMLANGNTTDQTSWINVQNPTNTGDLTDVVYFSATDNSAERSGVSAIVSDGTLYSWGDNSFSMLGLTGTPVTLPSVPNGFTQGTDVALFVENGGHLTPYVDNQGNVCNVGHNSEGGFGDGTTGDRSSYACPPVPAIAGQLCTAILKDFGDSPDTYSTRNSSNGPFHFIDDDLYVGSTPPTANFDGAPGTAASGDFDEVDSFFTQPYMPTGGMMCTGSNGAYTTAAGEYCVVVSATNDTNADAQLVSWLDFNNNGIFDVGEGSQPLPANPHPDDDGTFITGNVPANSGTNNYVLVFTGLAAENLQSANQTYSRVRLSNNDPAFFAATPPPPTGDGGTGEVHDGLVAFDILPVTLSSFSSDRMVNKIKVDWTTSSELFNVGFQLWGLDGHDQTWEKLHGWLIRTGSGNAVEPQSYTKTVNVPRSINTLIAVGLSSVDSDGAEHYYGPFEVNQAYGSLSTLKPIAWNHIRDQVDAQMIARGYVKDRVYGYRKLDSSNDSHTASDTESVVEFHVSQSGVYRITANDLLNAGIEWRSIKRRDIALIDHRGEAVVRYVIARGTGSGLDRTFGTDGELYFYAPGVDETVGLYSDSSVYRLVTDPYRALEGQFQGKQGVSSGFSSHYMETVRIENDSQYVLTSAADDPWVDAVVLGHPDQPSSYAVGVPVESDAIWSQPSILTLGLARSSALRHVDLNADGKQDAEHILEAVVLSASAPNGLLPIGTTQAVGKGNWTTQFEIPADTPLTLIEGKAVVGGLLRAGTGYAFSEAHVDSVSLTYARPYVAREGDAYLNFAGPNTGETGYEVSVPNSGWPIVFAYTSQGALVRLALESQSIINNGNGEKRRVVQFASLNGATYLQSSTNYWASGHRGFLTVQGLTPKSILSKSSLLAQAQGANYLVIAHPAFMGTALSNYASSKQSAGHTTALINYLDIVDTFGGGQSGPTGLTNFLNQVNKQGSLEYVLLVGSSVYDHLDTQDTGAMTFIPGHYGQSNYSNFTVTDTPYITQQDGDLFAAIGRWPVRTMADLSTIVSKSVAWDNSNRDNANALLIAEHTVAGEYIDFGAALNGVAQSLPASVSTTNVYVDQIHSENPGYTLTQALTHAKNEIIGALNHAPDVVLYNGHATTSQLSNKGLFKASDVNQITTTGSEMWVPMSCYLTYYESTHRNTLAHQLLFTGNAVSITGATLLSNQSNNITTGTAILDGTLNHNTSLGEAVTNHKTIQNNGSLYLNLSILGDPSQRF